MKLDKDGFVGKDALVKRQANGPIKQLVTLKVDAGHAPARGGASLMQGDTVVGTITSAEWGHRLGLNLAYAFVDPSLSSVGNVMQLDMYGDLVAVEVIEPSPYDPNFDRMRS